MHNTGGFAEGETAELYVGAQMPDCHDIVMPVLTHPSCTLFDLH
jgi:hypothetical protein